MAFPRLIATLRVVGPLLLAFTGLLQAACSTAHSPAQPQVAAPSKAIARPAATLETATPTRYEWQPNTHSPDWIEPQPELRNLAKRCPRFERGLMRVAEQVAERQVNHEPPLATEELKLALRAAGVPHVWERVWSLNASQLQYDDAGTRLDVWLGKNRLQGELRCGIARAKSNDLESLVVIAFDVIGDLAPLPTRARVGQWLSVDAQLHLPTQDAKVVVMGPTGAPRAIMTSPPHDDRVSARVALDQPGPWLIQVVSVHDSGPRPALEAMVFVDSEPCARFAQHPAPGEAAAQGAVDEATALLRMTNAARDSSGLGELVRDAQLDQLAVEQARAMQASQQLAHDLGTGGPSERVARAGLQPLSVGENLATANTLINAHRALWSSPSHRGAMLEPRFTSVGIGVVTAEDRSIWVCELFANFGSTGKIALPR
jgi:uncharacterized protein YkwD